MSQERRRRAFVLVIDACGIGAAPDAASYGDGGTNTLAHLADALGGLELPTLARLGLGSITPLRGVAASADPAIHGRLCPQGPGKDSISGHWELMGVIAERALPTYPHGFPPEIVEALERASGHGLLCNRSDNGLVAIEEFGAEHMRTGALIVYTSADSVLQLAAHVERVPPLELYSACERARGLMHGEHAVGRVIARPFAGVPGAFVRTDGRRDFALEPPARSYLQELEDAGVEVHGVGKIEDLFAGVGLTASHPGAATERPLEQVEELFERLPAGLVLANLIETDQIYGHRKDAAGFAAALAHIDARVDVLLERMREGDLLVLSADHGVDLAHPGSDHTRECVPLLAVSGEMLARGATGAGLGGKRHDGHLADVGASVMRWLTGHQADGLPGEAFVS
jgi:phosphopentomutase